VPAVPVLNLLKPVMKLAWWWKRQFGGVVKRPSPPLPKLVLRM
jgi:hypothetical protein